MQTSALLAGVHSITAVYSGDINFVGSTSLALSQNVLRATSTVVTSNRTPTANLGQNITFTATVRPVTGTGFPTTGSVQFKIDGIAFGSPKTLDGGSQAQSDPIGGLSAGDHAITADYSGDANFTASSAPLTQTVHMADTTTVVGSNHNPSVHGQAVTFTASVSAKRQWPQ